MKSIFLYGIRIDKVSLPRAVATVDSWLQKPSTKKHVIFTPNIEFLIEAEHNQKFREALNNSDLNIPDSSRFGWLEHQINEKNPIKKFFSWWLFPFSNKISGYQFPTTTGIDLIESVSKLASEKGYSMALLGGRGDIASLAEQKLKAKFPKIKIIYASSGGEVDIQGKMSSSTLVNLQRLLNRKVDILLVAFGHRKQEGWIGSYTNMTKSRVFIGCGGSLDYLSGKIKRAPKWVRFAGLEWLFRLIVQPWRIKRQWRIAKFLFSLI